MNTFEKFLAFWNAIPRQKAPDKEGDWEEKTVRVDVKTKEDFSFGINDIMSTGMFTETPDDYDIKDERRIYDPFAYFSDHPEIEEGQTIEIEAIYFGVQYDKDGDIDRYSIEMKYKLRSKNGYKQFEGFREVEQYDKDIDRILGYAKDALAKRKRPIIVNY